VKTPRSTSFHVREDVAPLKGGNTRVKIPMIPKGTGQGDSTDYGEALVNRTKNKIDKAQRGYYLAGDSFQGEPLSKGLTTNAFTSAISLVVA
jgi:hypothetical protein